MHHLQPALQAPGSSILADEVEVHVEADRQKATALAELVGVGVRMVGVPALAALSTCTKEALELLRAHPHPMRSANPHRAFGESGALSPQHPWCFVRMRQFSCRPACLSSLTVFKGCRRSGEVRWEIARSRTGLTTSPEGVPPRIARSASDRGAPVTKGTVLGHPHLYLLSLSRKSLMTSGNGGKGGERLGRTSL